MRKTVLITGASRGIGAEIARTFASEEYNVVICYKESFEKAKKVADFVSKQGAIPFIVKLDVSNPEQVKWVVDSVIKTFGKIDVLVSNAGIAENSLLIDTSVERINEVINVNLLGTVYINKYVVENMLKNQSGRIINISSMWGIVGASNEVVYSASKSAIIGFSKALAKEVGLNNITVNVVAPGVINTDMNKNLSRQAIKQLSQETAVGRIGDVKDVASVVKFLASDEASYITGQIINVSGGLVV